MSDNTLSLRGVRLAVYRLAIIACLCAATSACGYIDQYFIQPPTDTAQELYEAGNFAMQEKDYDQAAEYYLQLKDRYPFSPYALQAELALADAYYLGEEYGAAVAAYKEFDQLHPRHEETPYVLYQVGVANYKNFDSIDKPQTEITEALEYFRRLRQTYPESEYAVASAEYIEKCRRLLADHELYVADFYMRTEQFLPAYERYSHVAQNFQDLPKVKDFSARMAEFSYFEYQRAASEEQRMEQHSTLLDDFLDWL